MDTVIGFGNLERQVADELNAAAEYLIGIGREAADAATPFTKAGAMVAVARLALGVIALPAAGTFTLLSATMALSGSVAGLSTMAATEVVELIGGTVSQQSREAIDLVVDLGGSPFMLGFGVASAASFGAHELRRGVEIGRLVGIAADLKSLVTGASQIEQGSSAVGLLTGLLQVNWRKTFDSGNDPDGGAVPRSEAAVHDAVRERARADAVERHGVEGVRPTRYGPGSEAGADEVERHRIEELRLYLDDLAREAQLRAAQEVRAAHAEAERRQFEEQLRRDREESERKAREAEQLRKTAEEARQRAVEAEERARQEGAERERWWAQQEEQRRRQAQADAYAAEAERLSRLLRQFSPGGSFGGSSGPPAPSLGTGPIIGPT